MKPRFVLGGFRWPMILISLLLLAGGAWASPLVYPTFSWPILLIFLFLMVSLTMISISPVLLIKAAIRLGVDPRHVERFLALVAISLVLAAIVAYLYLGRDSFLNFAYLPIWILIVFFGPIGAGALCFLIPLISLISFAYAIHLLRKMGRMKIAPTKIGPPVIEEGMRKK